MRLHLRRQVSGGNVRIELCETTTKRWQTVFRDSSNRHTLEASIVSSKQENTLEQPRQ